MPLTISGKNRMVRIDEIAEAAIAGKALKLRSFAQDWLQQNTRLATAMPPASQDPLVLVVAAALVELLAERRHEAGPEWAHKIGAANAPLYLLKSAQTLPRLRQLCDAESPGPLRRRNLFAPPTFLEFA